MRILIAEDESVSRHALEATLIGWGHSVITARNGIEAWQILQSEDAPKLIILDWIMPGMSGVEVCQKIRETLNLRPIYIIILTMRDQLEDIVTGLQAGADDYVTKPFDRAELHARVQAGRRMLELQTSLANRVKELEHALSQIKQLQGLLPICSYCKKIRDDQDYWQQVEQYITEHSEVRFTHSICPDCYERIAELEFRSGDKAIREVSNENTSCR